MGIGWNIAAVMGVVALGVGLWGGYQAKKAEAVLRDLDAARAATVAAQADLNNCAARLLNIQEAQADEDHFDAIPDGSLGDDIPAHWLFPSGAGHATDDN